MIKIAEYIAILSGKGGVGKTTTTVNLGMCLHNLKRDVTIVDTNLATPNISLQLGFPPMAITLNSVLSGTANISDAVYTHESGLKIVPAGLSLNNHENYLNSEFRTAFDSFFNSDDTLVLMDCGAGLWDTKKTMRAADSALIVTNPELTALVDSLKAIRLAEKFDVEIKGIVLNKITHASYELRDETVTGVLEGQPIIAKIPFDKNVPKSIAKRVPIVKNKPNSPASRAFKRLAAELVGSDYKEKLFFRAVDFFKMR